MTTLNVQLSDELAAKLRARAAETGKVSIEAFASELISDHIELMDLGRPPGMMASDAPDLENKLVARINDPRMDVETTPAFWAGLKQGVRERGGDAKRP